MDTDLDLTRSTLAVFFAVLFGVWGPVYVGALVWMVVCLFKFKRKDRP